MTRNRHCHGSGNEACFYINNRGDEWNDLKLDNENFVIIHSALCKIWMLNEHSTSPTTLSCSTLHINDKRLVVIQSTEQPFQPLQLHFDQIPITVQRRSRYLDKSQSTLDRQNESIHNGPNLDNKNSVAVDLITGTALMDLMLQQWKSNIRLQRFLMHPKAIWSRDSIQ